MNLDYIKIHSNCFFVKGINRSVISDLQLNNSKIIPNELYEIILELKKGKSIIKIKEKYGRENEEILDGYINYIIENDWGFFASKLELDLFTELDLNLHLPSKISNAIVYRNNYEEEDIRKMISELELLSCKDIVLIFLKPLKVNEYFNLEESLSNTRLKSVELFTRFNSEMLISIPLLNKLSVLTKLYFFNAPTNEIIHFNENHYFDIIYVDFDITDFKFCGAVKTEYFNTNMSKVLESLNHNSCLHKKISIDKDGNIKNCPSMSQSFGNIKDTTLEEALNHPDFKKYWNINKDQIEVCKDCEFRHICTDCRAYTERSHFDGEIDLSKPLKCGYNPYTNEWSEWSTNPLKQKAIEYYGMQELVKRKT